MESIEWADILETHIAVPARNTPSGTREVRVKREIVRTPAKVRNLATVDS